MTESFNTVVNSHWEGGAREKELQRKVYKTSSREGQVGKHSSCLHPDHIKITTKSQNHLKTS